MAMFYVANCKRLDSAWDNSTLSEEASTLAERLELAEFVAQPHLLGFVGGWKNKSSDLA